VGGGGGGGPKDLQEIAPSGIQVDTAGYVYIYISITPLCPYGVSLPYRGTSLIRNTLPP
jgi:hypothetical protein